MSGEQIKTVVILFLVLLNILVLMSGCAMLQKVKDTILGKTESLPEIIPETSKEQLWQTIKGLTPNWLAIPVIALGAVAMFNGAAKLGMSCIIFGSVNLFMALATSRFGFYMAVMGLVGSATAVAASILAKNKALRDIIFGTQDLKHLAVDQAGANQILANKQAKSTKKIVAKIKTKAKLRGEI